MKSLKLSLHVDEKSRPQAPTTPEKLNFAAHCKNIFMLFQFSRKKVFTFHFAAVLSMIIRLRRKNLYLKTQTASK